MEETSRRAAPVSIPRVLISGVRLVCTTDPRLTVLLSVTSVCQGVLPSLRLWIGKLILDAVAEGRSAPREAFDSILLLLVVLLAITVASSALAHILVVVRELMAQRVVHAVNLKILTHAATLDLGQFEDAEFHDKLRLAQVDAPQRPPMVLAQLFQLVQSGITFVSLTVVLLRLGVLPWFVLVVLSCPQLLLETRFARLYHRLRTGETRRTRETQYLSSLVTSVEHFKERKVFRLAEAFIERYAVMTRAIEEARARYFKARSGAMGGASVLSCASYVGFYAYVAYLTLARRLTLGDVGMYAGAFSQCQSDALAVFRALSGLYESALFMSHLESLLADRPKVVADRSPTRPAPCRSRGLEFRGVSFKYPGSSRYAIRDVTFSVSPGERVAIVGSNGAGKSTLVKLVCRFYDPDAGEILLDGQDIRGYDPDEYRRSVAVVFQDFARYHFTARMNIGVGDIVHLGDLERVRSAAIASGADEFIRRWRDGYETELGRLFGGVELSTGEWQKIAIARALMSGGRLLVLDEPAAALDPESEENLHQRLREAAHGRACLIISHRLAVVMDADRIVTMEQGRIVEEGTHAELLERSGRYSELFTLQAARYGYAPALALPLRKG